MEPITKEMLQKASSDEVVAKNQKALRYATVMPFVREMYTHIKDYTNKINVKSTSYGYDINETKPDDYVNLVIEVLKEYFPGCNVYVKIKEYKPMANGKIIAPRKLVVVDWS